MALYTKIMRKNKTVTIFSIGITAFMIAVILVIYFTVVRHDASDSVTVSSYDGVVSFTLETSDENITDATVNKSNGFERAVLKYKDETSFIKMLKADPRYQRTFEYVGENGETGLKLLLLSERYYFTADIGWNGEKCAMIQSLFASVSMADVYPIFNSEIYVPFESIEGKPQGGVATFTVEEFNAESKRKKMKENAYTTYEELKAFYLKTDSALYRLNDEEQTIGVKIYSSQILNNGKHYYDGFPVSVRFWEDKIIVSYNLDIIFQGA